jgi:hypothetical protein
MQGEDERIQSAPVRDIATLAKSFTAPGKTISTRVEIGPHSLEDALSSLFLANRCFLGPSTLRFQLRQMSLLKTLKVIIKVIMEVIFDCSTIPKRRSDVAVTQK